jgi:hypothetical protein
MLMARVFRDYDDVIEGPSWAWNKLRARTRPHCIDRQTEAGPHSVKDGEGWYKL